MIPFWKRGSGETVAKTDRRQAWQEVAERVGGTFEEGKRKSGDRVVLEYGVWIVTLDTYTVHTGQVSLTYTRARAVFQGRGDLKLLVRERSLFDTILEKLGVGGTENWHRELASRYIIKGRPVARLRSLMTGGLTAALLSQPSLRVEVKKAPRRDRNTHGPSARIATVRSGGVVKDADRLVGMITVLRETLDALERAGAVGQGVGAGVARAPLRNG